MRLSFSLILTTLLVLPAVSNAGIIGSLSTCVAADVTASPGVVQSGADQCIGLLDKSSGSGPNDSTTFLNNAQQFDGGGVIWDANGAFGHNDWVFLGKDEQTSFSFLNATSADPATWTLDSAVSGDIIIAIKQANKLGFWFFDDIASIINGTFDVHSIFESGYTDEGWSHISIYSSGGSTTVPEPSSFILLSLGLAGLAALRKKS